MNHIPIMGGQVGMYLWYFWHGRLFGHHFIFSWAKSTLRLRLKTPSHLRFNKIEHFWNQNFGSYQKSYPADHFQPYPLLCLCVVVLSCELWCSNKCEQKHQHPAKINYKLIWNSLLSIFFLSLSPLLHSHTHGVMAPQSWVVMAAHENSWALVSTHKHP